MSSKSMYGKKKSTNPTALERVEGLEQQVQAMAEAVDQRLSLLGSTISEMNIAVNSLLEVLEVENKDLFDKVQLKAKEKFKARTEVVESKKKQQLQQLVDSKMVFESNVAGNNTLIICEEFAKDTGESFGEMVIEFNKLEMPYQDAVLNKEVGTTVELPNGNKLALRKVYDSTPRA